MPCSLKFLIVVVPSTTFVNVLPFNAMVYVGGGTEFALHVKVMSSSLGFVKQNLILLGLPMGEKIILTKMNMMQSRNSA